MQTMPGNEPAKSLCIYFLVQANPN